MKSVLEMTDEEVLEEAKKLFVGYGMKHTIRYATKREEGVHAESDAEHVFALIYLAHYFFEHEDACKDLDRQKVSDILLYHDFGEIKHGDKVTYEKTEEDEEKERLAAKEIFASLPEPLNQKGYECWKEYEDRVTPEARFCYALDKIEPLFELMHPTSEQSMKRLKITKEMNIEHKLKVAKDYPTLQRFAEVLSNDMVKRNVFWIE